jgi:hypothetical protein
LTLPSYLMELLPAEIKPAGFNPRKVVSTVHDGEIPIGVEIRDFRLPLGKSSDVWLRQIILEETERIPSSWWALYDRSRRSDVWSYRAYPDHHGHKVLTNYEIVDVLPSASGFDLRIYGSMFRPGGASSVTGKTFQFSRRDQTLGLSRVLNNFGFFQDYDSDEISLMTERPTQGRVELLDYDNIREQTMDSCNLPDQDEGNFNWTRMERAASCIAQKEKARYPIANRVSRPSRNGDERDSSTSLSEKF